MSRIKDAAIVSTLRGIRRKRKNRKSQSNSSKRRRALAESAVQELERVKAENAKLKQTIKELQDEILIGPAINLNLGDTADQFDLDLFSVDDVAQSQ